MSKKQLLEELEKIYFTSQGRDNIRRDKKVAPKGVVLGKVRIRGNQQQKFGYKPIEESKASAKDKYQKLYSVAKEVMKKHNPNFRYTSIQINKNNRTAKHVDANNVGVSYMLGVGDYVGGDIMIYDADGKNPKQYPTRNKWIKFDGSKYPHETTPFQGTRYTLVYYDVIKR
mgnify:FL=1